MTVPIQMISRKVVTLSCLQTGPHGALLRKAGHSLARYIRAEETFGYCHIHYTVYAMCIACGTSDRPVCSETNPQPSFPPLRLGLRVTRKSEKNTCRNTVRTDGNESIAPSARGGPSGLPQVLRLHFVCVFFPFRLAWTLPRSGLARAWCRSAFIFQCTTPGNIALPSVKIVRRNI